MQPSPSSADQPANPCKTRWFYVWWLPVLWVLPLATLWSMIILVEPGSHFGIVIAFAEWPVLWLEDALMKSLGPPWMSSNLVAAVLSCLIGAGIAGVAGFLQDLLHVPRPRRVIATYLVILLAIFLLVPYACRSFGIAGSLAGMLTLLTMVLVVFCNLVFLFSVGSVFVNLLRVIVRAGCQHR